MKSSVLWAAVLFACSDGPSAPGDAPGTFRATLSNALAETVTGRARYSQQCFTIWHAAFSNGTAGRIEIVKSTQGTLAGSLDVDLFGDGPVSGQVLHVSAKFSAICSGGLSC